MLLLKRFSLRQGTVVPLVQRVNVKDELLNTVVVVE